jgi:hypothetical protein
VEEHVEELPHSGGHRRRVGLDLPAEHLGGEEEEVGGRGRVGRGEEGGGHRPRLRGPLQGEEPLVGGEAGGRVRAVIERVDGRGEAGLELRRLGGVHLRRRRRRKAGRRGGWVDSGAGGEGTEGIGPSGTQSRTDGWGTRGFHFPFFPVVFFEESPGSINEHSIRRFHQRFCI